MERGCGVERRVERWEGVSEVVEKSSDRPDDNGLLTG